MSKSIAVVALVAGMLSLPGSVQAGGYDDYYYGGGHYGGYYAPYPPGPPLPPVPVGKRRSLRRRSTTRHRSMDGCSYLLRLPPAAGNIIIGLETTVQTRAMCRPMWDRDGEQSSFSITPDRTKRGGTALHKRIGGAHEAPPNLITTTNDDGSHARTMDGNSGSRSRSARDRQNSRPVTLWRGWRHPRRVRLGTTR